LSLLDNLTVWNWFGIVWSGDMKVICRWIEWKGKW